MRGTRTRKSDFKCFLFAFISLPTIHHVGSRKEQVPCRCSSEGISFYEVRKCQKESGARNRNRVISSECMRDEARKRPSKMVLCYINIFAEAMFIIWACACIPMRNSFSLILPRIMTRMVLRWLLGELVEICMSVVSRTYIRNGEHYECHQRNGYTFLDTNFRLCRPRFLHRPKSAVAQLTLFTPLEWQFVQRECSLEILWSKLEKLSECFAHNCAWNKSRRESTTSLLHCLCLSVWHWSNQPTEQINWNIK